jgi:hypothetical protein
MANTLLTPTMITREALRILHQKLNFVGTINRAYDDSFAKSGARIGTALNIRLPNQYTIRSGATLSAQDTTETNTTLTVSTQKGVDLNFTSADLTMSLDDFGYRILDPAMSVLAANIEADAMNMYKDVYNVVSNTGAAMTMVQVLNARKKVTDALAPLGDRYANLNTQDNIDLINANKGLFQDASTVAKQYREGYVGRTAGFDFLENTMWPSFTPGARSQTYQVNGASQTGSTLAVNTGTGAIAVGEVFTIPGCYAVHPETKATLPTLQQFTVTAAYAGGAGNISISPAIVTSGATQNVSNSPATTNVLTFVGTASTSTGLSLAYHKDAFTFATADLLLPKGVDFAAREVLDGISMRIVRAYDINNDKFPTRLDVLYGYKTIRPQLAVRIHNN